MAVAPTSLWLPWGRDETTSHSTKRDKTCAKWLLIRHLGITGTPLLRSVPQALVGQALEARVTARTVELLHRGQRVASHLRCAHKGGFTTVPEHLSAAHRAHLEWTPERLIHWGSSIGVATGSLVTRLLETRRHPEHGYRACLGLLALAKRYGNPRLEAACVVALELGTTNSTHVRDILANGRDQVAPTKTPEWTSPVHAHVRGPGYFQ